MIVDIVIGTMIAFHMVLGLLVIGGIVYTAYKVIVRKRKPKLKLIRGNKHDDRKR